MFWGSDKVKGEERTGTHWSCLCTWSLPGPTLTSCRTMTLVWRGEICSVPQTCRDVLPLTGREMVHTSSFFCTTGKCNDLLSRQAVHDVDGKAKAGSSPHQMFKQIKKKSLSGLRLGKIVRVSCSEVFAQLQYSCLVVSLWPRINQLRESHLLWMSTQIVKKMSYSQKCSAFFFLEEKKRKDQSLISLPKSPPWARLHA